MKSRNTEDTAYVILRTVGSTTGGNILTSNIEDVSFDRHEDAFGYCRGEAEKLCRTLYGGLDDTGLDNIFGGRVEKHYTDWINSVSLVVYRPGIEPTEVRWSIEKVKPKGRRAK